jgi:putative nucleotidyltransferase with HDIG domain
VFISSLACSNILSITFHLVHATVIIAVKPFLDKFSQSGYAVFQIKTGGMIMREEAYKLLTEYNKSDSLIRHALAVEAVMKYFADMMGEDAGYWGTVGLLHDLDYEMYPEQHCKMTKELLQKAGYDEAFIRAVMSHGYGMCTDTEPELPMEKVLYTIDELTGLVTAAAYMRPSRSVRDMEVKSVMKKFKDKAFAAGVNREVIRNGCSLLGMDLDTVIAWTIEGMRAEADALGL